MKRLRIAKHGLEADPTLNWLLGYTQAVGKGLPKAAPRWALNRVPFFRWIVHYDWRWSIGDFIAGLTVGLMLVPQSIAYARVATLPVQYGLFASYVGPILYTFIGSSKDLTLGPTAVVSLLAGGIIGQLPNHDPATVAIATAFMVGIYSLGLGVFKLGIILDFFPGGVLTGYTSGAALTIAVQQVPKLLGEYNVVSRNKTGTVIRDLFASLNTAHWRDILFALGSLTALILLQLLGKHYGSKNKILWFISVARNTFVVIIFTAISYGINRNKTTSTALISIIGYVPPGLYKPAVPDLSLLSILAGRSISVFLAAVLEHIAIGKAFARKEKYALDQNQELFSIGLINIVGSFFGAYAVTGSFSRTAVNNASGAKSPLSGLMCAVVVIISVVAVTPAFFYISNATLAAVIFLAVIQLVAGPKAWYQLWRLSFWDFLGGQLAFWITLFYTVEIGIYVSVGYSVVVLLWRVARPSLRTLGEVIEDPVTKEKLSGVYVDARDPNFDTRSIQSVPGVLILRLEESFTFPNSRYIKNQILKQVYAFTNGRMEEQKRNWNSNLSERVAEIRRRAGTDTRADTLPHLRGLILDFSAVNHLDSTGLQTLFDLRSELQDYAGDGRPFEMHFVSVHSSVLRILELADVAAPIDRPERAPPSATIIRLPLVRGDSRPATANRPHGPFEIHHHVGPRPSRNHYDEESGVTHRSSCDDVVVHSESQDYLNVSECDGHAAFLDSSNDRFFIHLSIKQALKVIKARLNLHDVGELANGQRVKEYRSTESTDTSGGQSYASNSASTSQIEPYISRPDPTIPNIHSSTSFHTEPDIQPQDILHENGLRLEDDL